MKILVGYATREGQSRKIARWVSDWMIDAGHSVEVLAVDETDGLDLGRFDRAVLVGSIHAGHYKAALVSFVSGQDGLNDLPVLFLSVSLAAAGHDAEEWRALDGIADDLKEATGWLPDRVVQVAGAYKPSEYDILSRFIMRRIIAQKDPEADLDADREYTDWAALGEVLGEWVAA